MLTTHERNLFHECRKALEPLGKTLRDATEFFVGHLKATQRCNLTIQQFKDEYLSAKQSLRAGNELSKAHIRDLQTRLSKFCSVFGELKLAEIGFVEIEKWLLNFTNGNRRNHYTVISSMFNEAVRLEYIDKSPMAKIEKPKKSSKTPEIFTVDELTSLLETAQKIEPDILPMVAICAFSGVRSEGEISRLEWSMVDLKRGHIDLPATVTKAGKRRVVPIQPNLMAWLQPYAGRTGAVLPKGARYKREAVCEESGVTWKQNALRHSFASYRLEQTKDAPLVAFELGHPSPALLYSTYREVVRPADAERYWEIAPSPDADIHQSQNGETL
ncbi:MAG TPA: tyrosine-type recombinase/integrase [Candidatus Udaeobacter sp.]|nr:tyrosine-type recombinase/integrase [Candidatus Udaeobacter sp.]